MDIAVRVQDAAGENGEDPSALLDRIESRLELFRILQRKYGATNTDVLHYREDAKHQLDDMENQTARLEELTHQKKEIETELRHRADALHKSRKSAAKAMGEAVMAELAFLEMGKVCFAVALDKTDDLSRYTKDGCDQIEFMVATNTAEPLRPLAKIASGGELSRIMLAMKCVLAGADGVATLIFDEIDTGVSGKTSQKVGEKLRQTAKNAQVLCVTHAAQIAALAKTHIFVSKSDVDGRTETALTYLEGDARVDALAAMMGGATITDSVKKAARELLATE
jgi:DNA repair protein RecN (Recombination protein N)